MAQRSFIGLSLPADLSQTIDAWRQIYDPKSHQSVPPHITIIPPFTPDKTLKMLSTKVEQTLISMPKFNILIKSFDCFTQHSNVIFAKVEHSAPLDQLRQAIINQLPADLNPLVAWPYQPFRPHITIVKGLRQADFIQLRRQFQRQHLEYALAVNHVDLFQKQDGIYRVSQRWSLSPKSSSLKS